MFYGFWNGKITKAGQFLGKWHNYYSILVKNKNKSESYSLKKVGDASGIFLLQKIISPRVIVGD